MTLSLFARSLLSLVFATICGVLMPAVGNAQPAGAAGENFIHRVQPGDTLIELSQRYTETPSNWSALQQLNAVQETTRLPIGLALRIPFSMIPEVPAQAKVVHVVGHATANQRPVAVGDLLEEGAAIQTGSNGFLTLTLSDGSTLAIPPDSALQLERVRVFRAAALTDTIFKMERGSLESQVAPQDTGVGRFEVRTPVSITGVRGTNLRVHTLKDGSRSEVLSGIAALSAGSGADQANLRPGQGAAVDATGKLLGVRTLLPAPVLSDPVRGGKGWVVSFDPVPGAVGYLVRVAGDATGSILFSSQRFPAPEVTFSAPGSGEFHLMVRAIDQDGLMGPDATLPFLGRRTLQSSDGSAVSTGYGQLVLLTEH